MSILVPTPANVNDTTLGWAQHYATDRIVRPSLLVRMVTDSNWIFHHKSYMSSYNSSAYDCAAVMNCGLPGQRIPGLMNWSVTESIDSVVQTAKLEIANALPVSTTTAVLQNTLPKHFHSATVSKHWVKNPNGEIKSLGAQYPLNAYTTNVGGYAYIYQEDRLAYREFASESIVLDNASKFPDPRIPPDEDDTNTYWPESDQGSGAYFILIGEEIIRVHNINGNTLSCPPGGRGINGVIQHHSPGATVRLLGFGPFTGKWAGLGYLSTNESKPYKSMIRPGTCLASFEGFGNFPNFLHKNSWRHGRNYEFTGYWFIKGHEAVLQEDGIPKVTLDLASTGHILQNQKISPNSIQRLRNQIVNWTKGALTDSGIKRNIPGDWVDFNSWQPDKPNSYPLAIKTEYAQDKQFFDHMRDTDSGKNCEFCQQEWLAYVNRPGYKVGHNPSGESRAVGKHIYHESIRVYNGGHSQFDGPLRTYGRLMLALAKAAWETPIIANPLAQRWTKIPNELWSNMEDFSTGRCWNGQLSFKFEGQTPNHPWAEQSQITDDEKAYFYKAALMCPFESTYDKQDWFQPLQDLAEMNKMTFLFHRRGFPIFIPDGLKLRGISYKKGSLPGGSQLENTKSNTGEWFMGWGGSISTYSYNMDPEQAFTLVYVSGTDAFENEFSVAAAGTGQDYKGDTIWYSSKVGNKEALQLTGGIQHVDTISLDNLVLGLDWNTNPAGWSLKLDRTSSGAGVTQIAALPALPGTQISKGANNNPTSVEKFKRLWNFLVTRRFIWEIYDTDQNKVVQAPGVPVNSKFGNYEFHMCNRMHLFLNGQGYRTGAVNTGVWTVADSARMRKWITVEGPAIKKDIWWYAISGYDWEYYVSAITGVAVPQRSVAKDSHGEPIWITDQLAYRKVLETWQQNFFKHAINIGNKVVDDSIQKATVRNWTTNIADPRIQLGDIVYLTIPGYLDSSDAFGDNADPSSPFRNATYITSISRTMDLQAGTYQGTYAGYRYRPYKSKETGKDVNLNRSNYYVDKGS